jgi:uncharacterized protein (DUF433 family)
MTDFPERSYSTEDGVIDIVSTPETPGGAPRIGDHRIAVYHVLGLYRQGYDPEEIASEELYPILSVAQVPQASPHKLNRLRIKRPNPT